MSKGFLGSLTAVLASAGLAVAQMPATIPVTLRAPAPAEVAPSPATLPPVAGAAATVPTAAADPPATQKEPEKIAAPQTMPMTPAPGGYGTQEQIDILAGRFYGSADYLFWWTKAERLPPLVTTGPAGTLANPPGVIPPGSSTVGALGVAGTMILFGNRDVDDQARSGMRFMAGYWLDSDQTIGIEASGFLLSQKGSSFATSSNGLVGQPILARPFISLAINPLDPAQQQTIQTEASFLVASPGQSGSVYATTTNELWGAEANGRIYVGGNNVYRADMLVGFRYLQVKDNLSIASTSTANPGFFIPFGVPPNNSAMLVVSSQSVLDTFATKNEFYGGQLGAHVEVKKGSWFADFTGKLALGVMDQTLNINGSTTGFNLSGPGIAAPSRTVPGGLYARPGVNLGSHSNDEFGVVPEVGLNVGYQFGEHLRAWAGYTVIYFRSDVIRPGAQLDRVVPTAGINGMPPAPSFPVNFKNEDFWAQGIHAGLEFSF